MNQQNSRPGQQGGFVRPEFTPGPGDRQTSSGPPHHSGVEQGTAAARGVRAEVAESEEAQLQERQKANRRRRRRVYIAVGAAVAVIVLIVALMIWLWSGELFLPSAN